MERTPNDEKQAEIVRLHVVEKLGAKSISRYFLGRPCRSTIIKILLKHGVYRGDEAACKPDEKRRQRVRLEESEWRNRMAACLRGLRNGQAVESIARKNGWNLRTVWSRLRVRPAYHRLRKRIERTHPDDQQRRRDGLWLSHQYPKEKKFQDAIRQILDESNASYSVEPCIKGLRVRGDFLVDSVFIECKVDVSHIGMTKALGQCWFYQTHTPYKCMLVVPDDVVPHEAWVMALQRMGAMLLNEAGFRCWVRGELSFSPVPLRAYVPGQ